MVPNEIFFFLLRNVAQETLNQVEDIETALNSSEHVRHEVMTLQGHTDEMIANINNITETVSKHPPVSLQRRHAAPLSTHVSRGVSRQARSEKCAYFLLVKYYTSRFKSEKRNF